MKRAWTVVHGPLVRLGMFVGLAMVAVFVVLAIDTRGFTRNTLPRWATDWFYTDYLPRQLGAPTNG